MLLVRNTQRGPTVFSDSAANISIEWQGAGDQFGGDVQPVPEALMENVNFLRAVQLGTFVIEEDSAEAQEKIRLQIEKINLSKRKQKENIEAVFDREVERPTATVEISEKGEVTHTQEPKARQPLTAMIETDNMVEEGDKLVAETKEVSVIIEPRQKG